MKDVTPYNLNKQIAKMMTADIKDYLHKWSKTYKENLITDILPFWLTYGLDEKNGGFYTSIDRDGTLMDTTKSVWFQGRAAYIYALAYHTIDPNPTYLHAAKSAIDFIEKHCFDSDGRMFFEISQEGIPLRKRRYLFSECFATIAMAQYGIATQDSRYLHKALDLFKNILKYRDTPNALQPKYMPSVQLKGHSLTMILLNTASVIQQGMDDTILSKQIENSIHEIATYFMNDQYKALLETVGSNGEFIDTAMGRTINPGHCIETSWFIMEQAKANHWNKKQLRMALQILDWSWQWGWDEKYGGIINFKDCKGFPHQDYSQDMKFWWPQTETIIATLYAYWATGQTKYFEQYKLANEWTYAHFPDQQYGEWYGYLHRDGTVAQPAKGNLFKGPFHIPRMMIKSIEIIDQIQQQKS